MNNKKCLETLGTGYKRLNDVLSTYREDNERIMEILNDSSVTEEYGKVFKHSFDEIEIEVALEDIAVEEGIGHLTYKRYSEFTDKAFSEVIIALEEMEEGINGLTNSQYNKLKDGEVFICETLDDCQKTFKKFAYTFKNEILKLVGDYQFNIIVGVAHELR